MVLHIIGSNSKGNCYILKSNNDSLIIECGVKVQEVKKALNFNLRNISGCLVTHQHKDHIGYVKEYLEANIPVYTNDETVEAAEVIYGELLHGVPEKRPFTLGSFRITPFYVPHNDTPCFAYKIYHEEIGSLLFLTDLEYCKYRFQNISQILVEANYSKELIGTENSNYAHVIKGHMELETTLDFLRANDNSELRNVVLLHLSDSNSDEEMFAKRAKEAVLGANVYVADAGMEIELNKEPF